MSVVVLCARGPRGENVWSRLIVLLVSAVALGSTRTLIVLENAADETRVRPLLSASNCLALVTSCKRIKTLDDVVTRPLDVLPPGRAVALLPKLARRDDHAVDELLLARAAELCSLSTREHGRR
jgi:hypothetical protein